MARIITSTLDIEGVYEEFFAEVRKLVDFDVASVVIVHEDRQELTSTYFSTPVEFPFSAGQTFGFSGLVLGRVLEARSAISINDLTMAHEYWPSKQLVDAGILSLINVPLLFERKIIGSFNFYSRNKANFGIRERVILERLASQVAPSVRNANLYQEADRFALALDSIGEAVAFLGIGTEIRHVNRTFEDTFGYTADELRGKPISMIDEDSELIDDQGKEIFVEGGLEGWSGEVLRRTKSGEVLSVLLTLTPVKDKNGEVIGRISVSRDITERKKTAQYMNEQSRLAAVGKLAAGVAHEINNPLTSILLGSQLLAESDLNDDHLSDIAIISDAALRAEKIVKNLLLFARRENPKRSPMPLDSIANQALELKTYDFRLNNISIVLDFEDDLPNSLVDSHQMSQVIVNILNNAEDAMLQHKRGGEITVKTHSTPQAVILEIRDDGPGIDPNLLGRIFEPFFTTKGARDGTGLGLSICHGIVQQHGGEMWATSMAGVGSSFFVKLPISERSDDSDVPDQTLRDAYGKATGRLLVVDDEAEIRQLVSRSLSNDLVVIDQADDGETALEMIKKFRYDCILLDLKMPGMSGMEVFEKSIDHDRENADRIIVMTGDTASPETASFLSNAKYSVMHKPFTLENARDRVKDVLERQQKSGR